MEQLKTDGYVNYRCRGPAFPLNCTDSVATLDGSEENRQSQIINVEVYACTYTVIITLCLCVIHVHSIHVCMHVTVHYVEPSIFH
jgi:hypothetical protein